MTSRDNGGRITNRRTKIVATIGPASNSRDMLEKLVRTTGLAALIATHNHALAAQMDRTVTIENGKIIPLA